MFDKLWLPVCLAGFVSGFALFVTFNLTSEKYPRDGCPKLLLRFYSYQMNEYFEPMDDEMVAELCKKTTAQPTVDAQTTTKEEHISSVKTMDTPSIDKYTVGIEITIEPTEKVPVVTELAKDAKATDEQISLDKIEELQSTDAVITPEITRPHLTGPPSDLRGLSELAKDLQALSVEPTIDEAQINGSSQHYLVAPPGNILYLEKEFVAKDAHALPEEEPRIKEMVSEKSPDTESLFKEILQNSDAMFIPYVSPFFYLTYHVHQPAVVTQDLIVKPPLTDVLSVGSIFESYMSPFLFLSFPTIDRQVTPEFTVTVDHNIPYEQETEVPTYSTNSKIMKRKGLSPEEEKCFVDSSKLCTFQLNEYLIPVNETLIPEYCKLLHIYFRCYFRAVQLPHFPCEKEFRLQITQDLMKNLCTEHSIQYYMRALQCAKKAMYDKSEYCKMAVEKILEQHKMRKGAEPFQNDKDFETCVRSIYRNKCFSFAILEKCDVQDYMSYGDLFSRVGILEINCKNSDQYSKVLDSNHAVEDE